MYNTQAYYHLTQRVLGICLVKRLVVTNFTLGGMNQPLRITHFSDFIVL